MTVSSVTVKPIENLKNWYKLTFVSRKDGIGETTTEMLVSGETLRMIRLQINQTLGENGNEPKIFS
jgi:hypothetical protein